MATQAYQRFVTATESLEIDFGPHLKAELDRGMIRMIAGGTYACSVVQTHISSFLRTRLRGSGCRPHGSDMAVHVGDGSIYYPDVSIDCGSPRVVIEVLSRSTREHDLTVKFDRYRAIGSIHTVAFVDPDARTIAATHRTERGGWTDLVVADDGDLAVPAMDLTIPHSEVFATN